MISLVQIYYNASVVQIHYSTLRVQINIIISSTNLLQYTPNTNYITQGCCCWGGTGIPFVGDQGTCKCDTYVVHPPGCGPCRFYDVETDVDPSLFSSTPGPEPIWLIFPARSAYSPDKCPRPRTHRSRC